MIDVQLSTFVPLISLAVGIFLAMQGAKKALKRFGVRHDPFVERWLPFAPAMIGAVVGAVFPQYFGLQNIFTVEEQVSRGFASFICFGVGFSSSGIYRLLILQLDEDSKARKVLSVHNECELKRKG